MKKLNPIESILKTKGHQQGGLVDLEQPLYQKLVRCFQAQLKNQQVVQILQEEMEALKVPKRLKIALIFLSMCH